MLEAELRHALHIPQARLEQLAELVGFGAELRTEQRSHDDAPNRGPQRRRCVEASAGHPVTERPVDLGDDQVEVHVDAFDGERRLHEPPPSPVVVAVGDHERGWAVHRDEGLHGLAPLEAVGLLRQDVLVGFRAEDEDHASAAGADIDDGTVSAVNRLHRPDEVTSRHQRQEPEMLEQRESGRRDHVERSTRLHAGAAGEESRVRRGPGRRSLTSDADRRESVRSCIDWAALRLVPTSSTPRGYGRHQRLFEDRRTQRRESK